MKKRILLCIIGITMFCVAFTNAQSSGIKAEDAGNPDKKPFSITPGNIPNEGIMFVDHEKNNRSGHTVQPVTECKNGDILAFYNNTWAETLSGHSCAGWSSYRRSTDGGKTWGSPVDLDYSKQIWDGAEVFSALVFGLVTAPDGTLIATVIRFKHHRWEKQLPPVYMLSYDNGYTWTGPHEFDASATVEDIAISYGACFVDGNEVFIVFNGHSGNMSLDSQMPHSLYVSSDNGESFNKRSVLPFDGRNFYETGAALPDGDIIVYTYPWRGHQGETDEFNMDYVISSDRGYTWSEVKKSYFAKAIRNPQMSARLGDYYFIHGRSGSHRHGRPAYEGDPGPQNFVLYSSKDGVNWDEGILLMSRKQTPGGGDCYSRNAIVGKYNPAMNERLLIQSDISYNGPRTNIRHWWVDIPGLSEDYPFEADFGQISKDDQDYSDIAVMVESINTISKNEEIFHGWPSVIMTGAGDLLAVYSGGREGHVCPFGRVELITSKDNGKTWSDPEILADSPLDDRDAGILETDKGTLLVTWFTSTAYLGTLNNTERTSGWPQEKLERWQKALKNMTSSNCSYPEIRKFMEKVEQQGNAPSYPVEQWMIRSEDGGKSWSEPYHVPLMSPNGPKLTKDNRLIWAGKDGALIAVAESFDDGRTWQIIGKIPAYPGHDPKEYHELDIIDCADGTLVSHIRNHNEPYSRETLQSRSDDGGKTWSVPRSIGVWGLPSHLLRLPDNNLLMTYGYRREPRNNYVRMSNDCGKSWSEPYSLGKTTGDFGYPTTAILPGGKLLTLWYQQLPGNSNAQLIQAIWSISEK